MNKKLYVGNLPYSVTTDDLRNYFSQAGTVTDAVVIIDSRTGRSKGFGFVEYEKEEDAAKAVTTYAGQDFQGRKLVVNEARPKVEDGSAPQEVKAPEAPQPAEPVEVKTEEAAPAEPEEVKEEVKEDK